MIVTVGWLLVMSVLAPGTIDPKGRGTGSQAGTGRHTVKLGEHAAKYPQSNQKCVLNCD